MRPVPVELLRFLGRVTPPEPTHNQAHVSHVRSTDPTGGPVAASEPVVGAVSRPSGPRPAAPSVLRLATGPASAASRSTEASLPRSWDERRGVQLKIPRWSSNGRAGGQRRIR